MEFTIGQNATLPLLKLQVVNDGLQDYDSMMKFIETSSIFFSMVNTENGIPKVYTKSAGFVEKLEMNPNASLNITFIIDLQLKIRLKLVDMKVSSCLLMKMEL